MILSLLAIISSVSVIEVGATKCGVATNTFLDCEDCIYTASNCSMSFWWNWDVMPTDTLVETGKIGNAEFIPMVWGSGFAGLTNMTQIQYLTRHKYVMGFNEPDHYGPPCWNKADVGGWVYPGCDGTTYNSAASSGTFLPAFNPSKDYSAGVWKTVVNQLLAGAGANKPEFVSPAMAGNAKAADGVVKCLSVTNASVAAGGEKVIADIAQCDGWLMEFKKATLQMTCGATNCWDIIKHIQFHAYTHDAQNVIDKVKGYEEVFADDMAGSGGRSKKTLWLTEVSGAYVNADDQVKFMNDLLPALESNPNIFKYSWFSEWAFTSFATDGIEPKFPMWRSSLFNPFGGLSPLGETYFKHCNGGTLPPTCK